MCDSVAQPSLGATVSHHNRDRVDGIGVDGISTQQRGEQCCMDLNSVAAMNPEAGTVGVCIMIGSYRVPDFLSRGFADIR